MSTHELAIKLAVLKVIADRIKYARGAVDCEVRDTYQPGDRVTAALPDGQQVGSVTLTKGRTMARVVDEAKFADWVAERYPHNIYTVTKVREAFTKQLLDQAKTNGAAVDANGEEIPGVEVDTGEPYPSVRLNPRGDELIAEAWQSGQLGELLSGLVRLELER